MICKTTRNPLIKCKQIAGVYIGSVHVYDIMMSRDFLFATLSHHMLLFPIKTSKLKILVYPFISALVTSLPPQTSVCPHTIGDIFKFIGPYLKDLKN